jgi:hypothetical protein
MYALGDRDVQLKPRVLLNLDGEVVKPLPQHRAA